jgi:Cu/Ag efflux pump CusA
LSFLPCSRCKAQEGRLFAPLAFTKTYAMAAAAFLSMTLIPVLMGLLIKGKHTERGGQSAQPLADPHLPAGDRLGAGEAQGRRC